MNTENNNNNNNDDDDDDGDNEKYLRKRYGHTVKYIITVVFMLQMVFYNAVVLYLPSMALSRTLELHRFYSILILGLIGIVYSSVGGVKAVVWSDMFQAALMLLALLVVGALGTSDAGGFARVFQQATDYGRVDFTGFLNLDLTTRHTLLNILIGSTLKHVYMVGVNQVQIQRALALPTLRQGQMAFCVCSIAGALIILLASYLGAVLVAAYHSCDPFLANEIDRRDALLVHYIARRLAVIPGFRGIFVAGVFSATLSTLSSFANSMAALALEDFIRPLMQAMKLKRMDDSTATWAAKALTIFFGLACVLMAYLIENANSRLLQATTTMFGAIGVPFLTAFALGIFTRFANTTGVLAGFAVTLSLGTYVTISQTFYNRPLQPAMPVHFNEHCAKLFNMTINSSELSLVSEEPKYLPLDSVVSRFRVDQISYMMLPLVQFVLMAIVTSLVSLLSGGWSQEIDDKYLIGFMQNRRKPNRQDEARHLGDVVTKAMRSVSDVDSYKSSSLSRETSRHFSMNIQQASFNSDHPKTDCSEQNWHNELDTKKQ